MNDLQTQAQVAILNEIIKKISDNTLQLASLPDVIVKINQVLDDDRKGMSDVAQVVQHDVSLTARIIQIANSPALRGSSTITSIVEAINRLGVTLVKNLALCVSFKDKMSSKNSQYYHILQSEIEMSLKCSVYGCVLSKTVDGVKPETLLIAGLVGRIGKLVTIRYIDESMAWRSLPASEAETIMHSIGTAVSELILRMWDFPENIRNTIFSKSEANVIIPENAHDIYMLTYKFVNNDLPAGISQRTQDYLDEHQDEINALSSMFK
jgi:HD-like signal output (HDOD) protein